MAPRIVNREERRRAIALASVEIFGEKGFEKTRMEDVAKAAGVGKGTIYEYFKTKDELLEGAAMMLFADMSGALMPDMEGEQSSTEILVSMLEQSIAAVKSYIFAYRFLLEYMIHDSRSDCEHSFMQEMLTGYREWLSMLLKRGVERGEFRSDLDTYAAASSIAAWVDGAVFHWYTLPDTVNLETMGQLYIELIVNGLKPRNTEQKEASDEGQTL